MKTKTKIQDTENLAAQQLLEEQMAAHVRGLKMHLRTLSKKKLVTACISLAVQLHNLQSEIQAKESKNVE